MSPISKISEVQSVKMKKQIETDVRKRNIKAVVSAIGYTAGLTGVVLFSAHCFKKGKFPTITTPIKKYYGRVTEALTNLYTNNRFVNKTVNNFLRPVYQSFKDLPKYIKVSLNFMSQLLTVKAVYDIFKNNELKEVADNFIDRHKAKTFDETLKKA